MYADAKSRPTYSAAMARRGDYLEKEGLKVEQSRMERSGALWLSYRGT